MPDKQKTTTKPMVTALANQVKSPKKIHNAMTISTQVMNFWKKRAICIFGMKTLVIDSNQCGILSKTIRGSLPYMYERLKTPLAALAVDVAASEAPLVAAALVAWEAPLVAATVIHSNGNRNLSVNQDSDPWTLVQQSHNHMAP